MRAARHPDDPVLDLLETGSAYRRFAHDNPAYYLIMFSHVFPDHHRSAEAISSGQAAFDELVSVITNGADAGVLICTDPIQAAARVWASVHGVVSLEMKSPPLDIDWDQVFEVSNRALLHELTTPDAMRAMPTAD
jgi:AcrR family transcriptional regulator